MTTTKERSPREENQQYLQENVDFYAKWIDKLGSGEVTEEEYEDTWEELRSSVYDVNYLLDSNRKHGPPVADLLSGSIVSPA